MPAPFNAVELAELVQGDFLVAILGDENADLKQAQENAAQTQALLIILDGLLQSETSDVKARQEILFKAIKSNLSDTKATLESQYPQHFSEAAIKEARAKVDARAGLAESNPAVPAYNQVIGRFFDKEVSAGALGVLLGIRLLNKAVYGRYAKARSFPNDSNAVTAATKALNELLETPQMTTDQAIAAIETAETVIREGLGKIASKDTCSQAAQTLSQNLGVAYRAPLQKIAGREPQLALAA